MPPRINLIFPASEISTGLLFYFYCPSLLLLLFQHSCAARARGFLSAPSGDVFKSIHRFAYSTHILQFAYSARLRYISKDALSPYPCLGKERPKNYEEGKKFADDNKLMFFETSAMSSYKVNESFEDLLQEIYNERRKVTNRREVYSNVIKLGTGILQTNENSKCC